MTPEFMAIVAVGIALAGLNLRMSWLLNLRIDRVEDRLGSVEHGMAELRERMARLEGLLDGLRESVVRPVA